MAKGQKPTFIYEQCMACHMCSQACPSSSIDLIKGGINKKYKKVYPELTNQDSCTGCGLCVTYCPVDAVVVS